jgi:hypothetical protein
MSLYGQVPSWGYGFKISIFIVSTSRSKFYRWLSAYITCYAGGPFLDNKKSYNLPVTFADHSGVHRQITLKTSYQVGLAFG